MPWKAAWRISQLAGGKVRFVLDGSGHIAGIINPPARAEATGRTRSMWQMRTSGLRALGREAKGIDFIKASDEEIAEEVGIAEA